MNLLLNVHYGHGGRRVTQCPVKMFQYAIIISPTALLLLLGEEYWDEEKKMCKLR